MKRGQIIRMRFKNEEQLFLLLQNDQGNRFSPNVIVSPLIEPTDEAKNDAAYVEIDLGEIEKPIVPLKGKMLVKCDRLLTLSKTRIAEPKEAFFLKTEAFAANGPWKGATPFDFCIRAGEGEIKGKAETKKGDTNAQAFEKIAAAVNGLRCGVWAKAGRFGSADKPLAGVSIHSKKLFSINAGSLALKTEGVVGDAPDKAMGEIDDKLFQLIFEQEEAKGRRYKRGDVVNASLKGEATEQQGERPCIVLKAVPGSYLVLPLTKAENNKKPMPTHSFIDREDCLDPKKALKQLSIVLGECPVTIGEEQIVPPAYSRTPVIAKANAEKMRQIHETMFVSLNLEKKAKQLASV